ncbi:MAG: hypothetical protein AB1798_18895, partial [Spirochaetota bacterium]
KRAKKVPIRDLVEAIERETGVGLLELVSRKRGEKLRTARGTLVMLAREVGYTMVELQGILKRDNSVLSRLVSVCETREGEKTVQRVREILNA